MAVRWGLLSTARINDAVVNASRASDEAEVVAVASRDARRAEEYARERGIERAYGGYEALLRNGDVEAVYVSLPNSLHVEWSIRALEAGKHVLCEKPLDRRPREVERAFDAADRAGRLLMEGFMYRHHPQSKRLKELVDGGAIGDLRQITSHFSFTLRDDGDVRARPELDGGALMDVGCYCVSVSRLLAGEPELATAHQLIGPTGVDVRLAGQLRFATEVLAQFHCGFDLPASGGVTAIGSDGSAHLASPFLCRDPAIELRRDGAVERVPVDDVDRFRLQLENVADAVRGRGEPLLGRADALGQARTIDALYRAAASGRAERV